MKHLIRILVATTILTALSACEKDKVTPSSGNDTVPVDPSDTIPVNPGDTVPPEDTVTASFALVLNEGNLGANNASVSRFNPATGDIDNQWFDNANHRGLGNQAQDMIAYGSKVYITVTESNSLEVLNPQSGLSQRVDMGDRRPRSIAADGGKLYITCYNPCCVVRVDTASLQIEATCPLGQFYPEGIAIAQGKAFVASSYQGSNYDNKLYVVDLGTFANPEYITVGMNLSNVKKVNDNKIIVSWIGNYNDIPSGSAIIDATSHQITLTGEALQKMDIYNGKVYGYSVEYDEYWNETNSWKIINADGSVEAFPFTVSLDANAYGININPANGDIFITSSDYITNGDIYCFTPNGTRRFKVEAAALPSKILFF